MSSKLLFIFIFRITDNTVLSKLNWEGTGNLGKSAFKNLPKIYKAITGRYCYYIFKIYTNTFDFLKMSVLMFYLGRKYENSVAIFPSLIKDILSLFPSDALLKTIYFSTLSLISFSFFFVSLNMHRKYLNLIHLLIFFCRCRNFEVP